MLKRKIAGRQSLLPAFFRKNMNRRKEKTVITVETFQRTIIYSRRKAKIALCEQCAAEAVMLAPNEAAAYLQTTAREIFRRVEAGEIHYLETETGALLVCRKSLATENNNYLEKENYNEKL